MAKDILTDEEMNGEAPDILTDEEMMDDDGIAEYIRANEGTEAKVYDDTSGNPTVGIGHKLKEGESLENRTPEQIEDTFQSDVKINTEKARRLFPKFDSYSKEIKQALTDGAFRGDHEVGFKTTAFINSGKWKEASEEYINRTDYRESKASEGTEKPFTGVYKRLDRNAKVFSLYGDDQADFDPEGSGYDMESALRAGLTKDKTGHWGSRDPETGLILKGRKHPTFQKTLDDEKELGYTIEKQGNRYYSFKDAPDTLSDEVMNEPEDKESLYPIEYESNFLDWKEAGFPVGGVPGPTKKRTRYITEEEFKKHQQYNEWADSPVGAYLTGGTDGDYPPVSEHIAIAGLAFTGIHALKSLLADPYITAKISSSAIGQRIDKAFASPQDLAQRIMQTKVSPNEILKYVSKGKRRAVTEILRTISKPFTSKPTFGGYLPPRATGQRGSVYIPSGKELTDLAKKFGLAPREVKMIKAGNFQGLPVAVSTAIQQMQGQGPRGISKDIIDAVEGVAEEEVKPKQVSLPVVDREQAINESEEAISAFQAQKDLWFGNKDVRIHQTKLEKVKLQESIRKALGKKKYDDQTKAIDKAVQIYIDLKRNPEHYDKFKDKLTPEQLGTVELSRNLPLPIKQIADQISGSYESLGFEALEADVIKNVIDNYAGRRWDLKGKEGVGAFRKFKATTGHARGRKYETILEGWASGKKLKVEGATNNLATLKEEIIKTIEDKRFLKSMQKIKTIEGQSLVGTKQLEGYVRIEHPNFKEWKWTGKTEDPDTEKIRGRNFFTDKEGRIFERKELYAPKEVAQNLNNILGISKLKGIPAIDFITKYNAVFKALILQSSFYHHQAFMRSYYLGTQKKRWNEMSIRQAYRSGLEAIKSENPIVTLGVKNGLTLGLMQDWDEDLLKEESGIDCMMNKMGVVKTIKDKILNLRQQQADFLFGKFGAGLKAKAFMIEYRNLVKDHPNKNVDELAKMAANLINDDFGGLHLQRLGRNPTVQHIFRLFALAPDWTESNVRTMIKSVKAGGKEESEFYRRFWAGILTKGVGLTVIANLLTATMDKDSPEAKGAWQRFIRNYKRAWKEGRLLWLDVDITPLYNALGGKTERRKYVSLLGHFKDPLKFIIHPIRSAHHKGSVIYKMFHEALVGVDWAGRRITTASELFGVDYDKGYYKTTRKGRYKKGDPKFGKLKGKTVTYDWGGKKGPISYEQIPSYMLAQVKGIQPVQVQNLIGWVAGSMEGFDTTLNSLGVSLKTTYEKGAEKKKKSTKPTWKKKSSKAGRWK